VPRTFCIPDDYIDRLLAEAPPLSVEQADRLRILLAADDRASAA